MLHESGHGEHETAQLALCMIGVTAWLASASPASADSSLSVVVDPAYFIGVVEVVPDTAGEAGVRIAAESEDVIVAGPLERELMRLRGQRVAILGTLVDNGPGASWMIVSAYRPAGESHWRRDSERKPA